MVSRSEIVVAAQSFVGEPFDPRHRSKGFLLAVGAKLGVVANDVADLQRIHPSAIQAGDIVVLRLPQPHSHVPGTKVTANGTNAIITQRKGSLCVARPFEGRIVEHLLSAEWRRRIVQAFELRGVK